MKQTKGIIREIKCDDVISHKKQEKLYDEIICTIFEKILVEIKKDDCDRNNLRDLVCFFQDISINVNDEKEKYNNVMEVLRCIRR